MIYYIVPKHSEKICEEYISQYVDPGRTVYIQDSLERRSMMKKYNDGIRFLEYQHHLDDDDIIVFVHEDVKLMDPYFETKIINHFRNNPKLGVAGIYGTVAYNGGGWWNYDRELNARGHIIQAGPDGMGSFPMVEHRGNHFDIVTADGCMLAVKYARLKQGKFREEWEGFHHYDNSFCIDTLIHTDFDVGVLDITIYHASIGEINKGWHEGSKYLMKHYSDLGLTFPITKVGVLAWKRSINIKNEIDNMET